MIIIDGRESELTINNFANLEELLISATSDQTLGDRIVTDVFVNDEAFSELYPHQAEDISSNELQRVEICSVPYTEMAMNIAQELDKVTAIMSAGGRRVAALFRQADDDDALELFQDLLEVTRDFISMIGALRANFFMSDDSVFVDHAQRISALLTEMSDVLADEDWILLADLVEYEFVPETESWKEIIQNIRENIRVSMTA